MVISFWCKRVVSPATLHYSDMHMGMFICVNIQIYLYSMKLILEDKVGNEGRWRVASFNPGCMDGFPLCRAKEGIFLLYLLPFSCACMPAFASRHNCLSLNHLFALVCAF
jgi:hypothetical protein